MFNYALYNTNQKVLSVSYIIIYLHIFSIKLNENRSTNKS